MTVFELMDALDDIINTSDVLAPEVYIQIGNMQVPVSGVEYFPEIKGIVGESVVIGDSENPNLIL